jgi:hypothetical protein
MGPVGAGLLPRTAILDDVNDSPFEPLPYKITVMAEKLPSRGPKSRPWLLVLLPVLLTEVVLVRVVNRVGQG